MSANGRSSRRSEGSGREDGAIRPRYRRAFGCVTWVNMGMLVFLALAYILPLPFRLFGDGTIPEAVPFRLTLFGLLTIIPGLALGAVLGARTYRAERRRGTRAGAGVGAIIGWTSFFILDWIGSFFIVGWDRFFELDMLGGAVLFVFGLPLLVATGLVFYGLYAKGLDFDQSRALVLIGGIIVGVGGLMVITLSFNGAGAVSAVISALAGALAGWVGGAGYARAGGDEMIPPGATIVRRGSSGRK